MGGGGLTWINRFLLSQAARRGPSNDWADLSAVVDTASQQTRIELVLADAEFDSERNLYLHRQLLGAHERNSRQTRKENLARARNARRDGRAHSRNGFTAVAP